MNRLYYFNYIEEKLTILSHRTIRRGKLNLLEINGHSEDLYQNLLNRIYKWKARNLNSSLQNVEAIDLIDEENKLIVQVSATSTKSKIESALSKKSLESYSDHRFKFISIAHDSSTLRSQSFANPYGVQFNPKEDILDLTQILSDIKGLDISSIINTYELIKAELGSIDSVLKYDSNLAAIINILSKENFTVFGENQNTTPFNIDQKIAFNSLTYSSKAIIDDYAIHHSRLSKNYDEIDKMGSNKSLSVIQLVRDQYVTEIRENKTRNPDTIFHNIIRRVQEIVLNSSNYDNIPLDELSMCVGILVVDTFIRCRIFENPTESQNVTTR